MAMRGYFPLLLIQAMILLLAKVSAAQLPRDSSQSPRVITGCPKLYYYPFLCPKQCDQDVHCKSGLKCCSYGCAKLCVKPKQYSCRKQYPDLTEFCKSWCRLCEFGSSPNCLSFQHPMCQSECAKDEECAKGKLCCMSGCSRKCIDPIVVEQKVKYGSCPISPKGLNDSCFARCFGDEQCPGAQKCCKYGCSIQCMEPVHPGSCPVQHLPFPLPCHRLCLYDSDCSIGFKCCRSGCSSECLRAITALNVVE